MKIAYVRVSTLEQNDARQLREMERVGVDMIFKEKISGKNIEDRLELQKMLAMITPGDVVYIHDFSRLARSTKDLLDIVELLKQKGASLVSFKENIDTETPTGKLMLTMIAAINEFERLNLLERQKEGIDIAKQMGKYRGRKGVGYPKNWELVYKQYKDEIITVNRCLTVLGIKKGTFYRLSKLWEADRKKNKKLLAYIKKIG